jgi:hypothetical protein
LSLDGSLAAHDELRLPDWQNEDRLLTGFVGFFSGDPVAGDWVISIE